MPEKRNMMAETDSPSEAQRPKSRGIVVPHTSTGSQRFAAWILASALRLVAKTLRYRIHDPHGFLERKDISQAIYCIWHNRLDLCMKLYVAFEKHRSKTGMA